MKMIAESLVGIINACQENWQLFQAHVRMSRQYFEHFIALAGSHNFL